MLIIRNVRIILVNISKMSKFVALSAEGKDPVPVAFQNTYIWFDLKSFLLEKKNLYAY